MQLVYYKKSIYQILTYIKMNNEQYKNILDYVIQRKLGQGSFGQVLLGKNRQGKYAAIKKISKQKVIKVNKLHEPFIEKQILIKISNSQQQFKNFFISLYATHSDEQFVYLMLQFCQGGTLDQWIRKNQTPNIQTLRKIMIKLVLMMQNLHSQKLIHRDLKPSNILLTKDGHLKLSDFGTCYAPQQYFSADVAKQIKSIKGLAQTKKQQKSRKLSEQSSQLQEGTDCSSSQRRRYTFVGTACYMAPQLLNQDKCGPQSDLWALGCIFYQILHKKSPFYDESQGMIWTKILNTDIKVIQAESTDTQYNELKKHLSDLIQKLLTKDNEKRLGFGNNGYNNIKNHPFFMGIKWSQQKHSPLQTIKNYVNRHISQLQLSLQKKIEQKDKVLFSGVVAKKMYFGNYKQRTLVLLSFPKLVYYDSDSGQKKGQILLSKNTPIKLDGKYFQLTTQKKTYYYKTKQACQWVEMIRYAIMNAFY